MTNFEYIKSLSLEELANLISNEASYNGCRMRCPAYFNCEDDSEGYCDLTIMKWLSSERS